MSENSNSPICASPAADDVHTLPDAFSNRRLLNGWFLAVGALAVCWVMFFNELRGEWSVNPQYNYGYLVPLLGIMLTWRRWRDRPGAVSGGSAWAIVVTFGSLLFLLPLTLILEANPEWRLIYWAHGFLVLILSCCLLYRAGGWTWIRFFAPSLAFILIAVPWPMEFEQGVIQGLMRWVAGLTVDVAGWLGIPAVQHGNLIEVGTGVVGIDEACSGVRSLQSALMISLFLSELHRFSLGRRAGLLISSLLFVIFANVARTSFLTWAAASRGLPQMQAWHEAAGVMVMIIVLPSLLGLALLMKPKTAAATSVAFKSRVTGTMPCWAPVCVVVWIGIVEAGTATWYRAHETDLVLNARWSVAWPLEDPHFRKTAIPEESLAILRCSNSDSAAWEDDEGNKWSAFFLRWNPGKNSAQLAMGHRPDICFPAAGAKLVKDFGQVTANVKGVEIPSKCQAYESGSHLVYVFYCLWSDHVSLKDKSLNENGSWSSRLQAVLAGKRNLGQQVLEVVLSGPESSETATSLFQQQLNSLVQRK